MHLCCVTSIITSWIIDIHGWNNEFPRFRKLIKSVDASDWLFYDPDDFLEKIGVMAQHEMRRVPSIIEDQVWLPTCIGNAFFWTNKFASNKVNKTNLYTTRTPLRLLLSKRKSGYLPPPTPRRLHFELKRCCMRTNELEPQVQSASQREQQLEQSRECTQLCEVRSGWENIKAFVSCSTFSYSCAVKRFVPCCSFS